MALAVRQVTQAAPSTDTTQDYTSSGFGTPTWCMVIATHNATADTWANDASISIGFYDGTNQKVITTGMEDGANPAAGNQRDQQTDGDVVAMYYDSTLRRSASAAFITDGVRLTWADLGQDRTHCTVIFGKGETASVVGWGTPNATQDASSNITTTGCDPNLVLMVGTSRSSENAGTNTVRKSYGFAYDTGASIEQFSVSHQFGNGDPTDMNSQTSNQYACSHLNPAGHHRPGYDITAMGTGQFTVTTRDNAGAGGFIFLALEITEAVTTFAATTPTSAGDFDPFTCSNTPLWVMMLPTAEDTLNTNRSGTQSASEGFGIYSVNKDGDEQGHYMYMENGTTGAGSHNAGCKSAGQLAGITVTSGAVDEVFDGNSPTFDTSGIVYADANFNHAGTAYYVLGFAVEQPVSADTPRGNNIGGAIGDTIGGGIG